MHSFEGGTFAFLVQADHDLANLTVQSLSLSLRALSGNSDQNERQWPRILRDRAL